MFLNFFENVFTSNYLVHLFLLITLIGWFVYHTILKNWNHFSNQNLKFIRGWPFFGVQYEMFLRSRRSFPHQMESWYYAYPNEKVIGIHGMFGGYMYILRDTEVIKQITIKDFDHFVNHQFMMDETIEPVFGRSLFFMKDHKWKLMRSTLSPVFTGSKMKLMFNVMNELNVKFVNYLYEYYEKKPFECEMKDLFTRYATDVIATCAFGLDVNSLKDKENIFYKLGQSFSDLSGLRMIKFMLVMLLPKLAKLLRIRITNMDYVNYFKDLVMNTIAHREKNNIVRHDMINLLIEVRKGALVRDQNVKQSELDAGFATVQESTHWKSTDTIRNLKYIYLNNFFNI